MSSIPFSSNVQGALNLGLHFFGAVAGVSVLGPLIGGGVAGQILGGIGGFVVADIAAPVLVPQF